MLEVFRFGFVACLNCQSLQVGRSLCCAECEKSLLTRAGPWATPEGQSLFHWNPHESDLLSTLILQLKGGWQTRAWHFWAEQFLLGLPFSQTCSLRLIPSPRRTSSKDHAFLFAEALANLTGGRLEEGLFVLEDGRQRQRNRHQRQQRRIVKRKEPQDGFEGNWVFVDDVITTGATWRATKSLLPESIICPAWTLARRRGLDLRGPPHSDRNDAAKL